VERNLLLYQPIEDYGVIGNVQTVALVGTNGSIDLVAAAATKLGLIQRPT
jgi:hypothetical protein